MALCLSDCCPGKKVFCASVLALTLGLAVLASPARAVDVGYYDMSLGAGNATQVPPITAAGHTAVQLFDLQSSNLSGIDVLFVQNPSNGSYGAEYLSRLADIEAAVAGGMILVLHDRRVTGASGVLPGGSGFVTVRDLVAPESNDINILDATSPVVSSVINGVTRTLTATSLDGGGFSSHGYAEAGGLPAGAKLILWRPKPGDAADRSRIVTFAYAHGDGAVIYSTIPLDLFLAGSGPNPPRGNFTGIYAPNVVHYAALLAGGAPDLSVTISDGQSAAVPGETVTYTVRAQNSGIGAAVGARVLTDLSAALDGIAWSCAPSAGADCSASGSGDIDDLVDLPVGGSVTYTVSGTVAAAAVGTLQSLAEVMSAPGQTDPVPANNVAADTDVLTPAADLRLQKTGPATAAPGGTVAYTLTVHNDGPSDASSVQLSDPTPPGLAFVSATSPCSGGFPCNLGTLAAGAQTSVTVTFSVPSPYFGPDPIVNLAAVRSSTSDPVAANNTARSSTPAGGTASADLRLFLTAPPSAAKGSSVTFIARVVNLGPHDAAGVTLSYTPPAGLLPPSPCCSFGSLEAGAERTVRLTFGIPAGYAGANPISFSASVSGSTADPSTGNNTASASVPLGADTADLAITKTGPAAAAPGTNVVWTLVVTNHGPAAAVSTLLNDPTPAGLTFVTADAPCATGFPCSLGTLAAGQKVTVRATFHVPSNHGGDPIQNTASVSSATPEGFPADNTATALTGAGAEAADLAVALIGPATAPAGTELTYTFLVANHGPGIARDAFVDAAAPGGLTLVRATAPCAGGFPCDLGDLPPGASLALSVTWRIPSNHVSPNPLVETVDAGSDSTDPVPGNDSGTVSTAVVYVSDLGVTKTDGQTQVAEGMVLTYTIGVTNPGPSDVAGATVTDAFPAGLTGVTWTCAASAGAHCTASGSGHINDTVNLARGASLTYTALATVNSEASGALSNTASAAVPAGVSDPAAGNNSATDTDSVLLPADLVVEKTGSGSVTAGTQLTYTLRVTNRGTGTATSVVLAHPAPAGLTFVSAGAPCASGFPCSLPDLGPDQLVQVAVTYAVPPGYAGANPVSNTASASTATPEANPADNSATWTTDIVFSSDLSITKTDGRSTLVPGEPVTYTIVVANAGPSHDTGATVTDTPPAELVNPAWTCAAAGGASCGAASGTGGIAQTVSIPVGGSLTYQLTATLAANASTAVVNQAAVVAGAASDPVLGNNLASDTDGLSLLADLSITKTDGKTSAVPGEPVTWTVVAANAGPSHATGVTVTDTPPAALLSPAWTCSGNGGASCPASSGTGGISQTVDLPAGGSLTWQLTGTVDPAATGTLANTATVGVPAAVTDPATGNNSATDSEPLTRVADLRLTRSGPGTVARGAELAFTFTVTNAGPSQALAEMTAPTPAGLTFVSATAPCTGGFPCSLGQIPPGGEATVTVRYQVPAGYAGSDPIVHLAALESDASDPTPGDTTSRSATADDRAGQADLSLAKTAPSVSAVGSTVTYRLTVTNHGPDDALGVSLDESLPAGLTFVSATAPCQTGLLCALGYLPAGGSRSIEMTLAIPAGYSGPTLIVNNATVTAATADPAAGNNTASAVTTLIAAPIDLAVVKRGPVTVAAGQNVVYTLQVTNRGPAAATNTRLSDPAPAGLTFVSATAPCAGGFPCFLDTVAAGQTVTVQATFHVPAGYAGANPVVNTASAVANELDGVAANDSATAVTGVGAQAADLEVTKTGPAQAFAGGFASYNLLVRNLGPGTATAVVLNDPAPAGTTFESATAPCAGGFPCTLGDLPAGSAVSILATFRLQTGLAQGTVLTNTASLTATSVDPAAGNNSASVATAAQVQADLKITKTDGAAEIAPGQPVTYTIAVTNLGPSDAPGVRVVDSFPASLTGISWICNASPGSSCAPGAGGTGNIDRLVHVAAGGTVTYTATATVVPSATGTLSNTATVQPPAGLPDPVAGNNSATDTDTLTPRADLAITKTDGSATAVPGRTVTYTITVSNLGPSDAPVSTVTDTFPSDLSAITWTCAASSGSACTASGGGQILDTVRLPAGGTVTYTATALLSAAATQPLVNTATVAVQGGVTDPALGNNSATDTDSLAPQSDLAVVKDDGLATATAGGAVTYTITVTNLGPSNATGVSVTDTFPSVVTAVSWTCSATGGGQCGAASGSGNLQQTANVPVGGSVVYQAAATLSPAASGTLVNTASVAPPAGTVDPVPGNNSEGDTDNIVRIANLSVTKTTGLTEAVPGEPVTYTITVTNAGPSNAAGISVSDVVPVTLQLPAWTCAATAGSSCTTNGTGNIADTATLAAGGTLIYTLTATLAKTATGTLANTAAAAVAAGTTDPQPGNNSSTSSLPIALRPFDFYTISPCRLLDTRLPDGSSGGPVLTSGVPRALQATGACGIPATAKALAVNVTAVSQASSGFLRIYPDGDPIPNTTAVNFAEGENRANNAILPLGPAGGVQILPILTTGAAVHVVVDVTGYFD